MAVRIQRADEKQLGTARPKTEHANVDAPAFAVNTPLLNHANEGVPEHPVTFAVKVVVPPPQILSAPEMETEAAAGGAEIVTSSLEDAKVCP